MNINHNRNNSVKLRNFSDSQDHHDVIKLLLCRMLRRKHKSKKVGIYTEYSPLNPNDEYPDICVIIPRRRKGKIVNEVIVYEVQKEVTDAWTMKINQRYEDVDLIIVPVKELPTEINALKKELEKYIV